MEDDAVASKDASQEGVQSRGDFLELRENEHFFPLLQDRLAEFSEALEFAAVLFIEGPCIQELVGMITDLLAFHQRGRDETSALHAFIVF